MNEPDNQPTADQTIGEISAEDALLFKVCVAAIWSDGAMAAAERDHLSTLMDRISASEDDRHELRRIALDDVSRSTVLTEVGDLDAGGKLIASFESGLTPEKDRFALAALILGSGCGRYGPPLRAPEYRAEGRTVTEATSAMGRGSERADEADEDE